jgi:hypothetical protein
LDFFHSLDKERVGDGRAHDAQEEQKKDVLGARGRPDQKKEGKEQQHRKKILVKGNEKA